MTKRVRVLVSIASPTWSYAPGDMADIDAVEAERWIAANIAEPVATEIETAVSRQPETTARRGRPPKGGR